MLSRILIVEATDLRRCHNFRQFAWFVSPMDQISEPHIIELEPDHVRRVRPAPRKLFGFYLLPVSVAGLLFTLFAYGWPWPVAGSALFGRHRHRRSAPPLTAQPFHFIRM